MENLAPKKALNKYRDRYATRFILHDHFMLRLRGKKKIIASHIARKYSRVNLKSPTVIDNKKIAQRIATNNDRAKRESETRGYLKDDACQKIIMFKIYVASISQSR